MIQRRLYLYIVGAVSLGMLLIGLANLGATTLNALLNATPGARFKDAYAGFGAVTLVGLPVWAVHWGIAQRLSARHEDERASAIRRLYIYLVLAALAIATAIFARRFLEAALGAALGPSPDGPAILRDAWITAILLGFWLYHFRVSSADRTRVGEVSTSATLRRWYAYGLLTFGLAFLLFGARDLLQQLWVLLVEHQRTIVPGGLVASALATMLTGFAVFAFHSRWTSRDPIAADDRRSTLRAVAGFLALAVSVALALTGASRLLYYVLDRALGVQTPQGVGGDLLLALANPAATVVVFTFAWVWIRRQLAADAGESEAARQAGVRHLYTHLVAFLALATMAVGAAGLLWTLSDQLLNHLLSRPAVEWRDQTSLFVTLALVGTPMWATHWRAAPDANERTTLSRRLYLYAALLGSVLALLTSGAILVYRLLGIVLALSDAGSGAAVIDIGRATAVILVAAALGLYHWRILRQDAATRPTLAQPSADGRGDFDIAVKGASEEELRRLLNGLPRGATYSLAPRPPKP
jgi:hypothetical protein